MEFLMKIVRPRVRPRDHRKLWPLDYCEIFRNAWAYWPRANIELWTIAKYFEMRGSGFGW